jgi:hypothetical protein
MVSREAVGDAIQSLNELEPGTIDYPTLQNRTGHLDLLSGLLTRETSGSQKPDAVIFLGPLAHSGMRIPAELLDSARPDVPVYLCAATAWRSDPIRSAML